VGNQVFSVNDRVLFFLNNNTIGYDQYNGIFGIFSESQLVEPEWEKCNIFEKEIPREHWVFGGRGQMPTIRQGNNTNIENFTIGKEILVTYDIFNHSLNAKNVTYGIMIKNLDEPDYLYTEINNSYLLEACVPYKTLTWDFTPSKSGHYAVEFYDINGSHMTIGFTVEESLPFCTSDRTACFDQDGYKCDPTGWDCRNPIDIFNTIDSPLKQFKSGILYGDIQCKDGLGLVVKTTNRHFACVKPESISKLFERGWTSNVNLGGESSRHCYQEPEHGICNASREKYYFNWETRSCKSFTWGGCGGSVPFDTLQSCKSLCN
jgi:hypothetical protein